MQSVEALDLPHLSLEDPTFGQDPYSHFRAAKKKHSWLAKSNYGYVVHEYQAIKDLYALDRKLDVSFDGYVELLGAQDTEWGRYMHEQIMSMPAPEHRALRNALHSKFTPRFADSLRPIMRANISALLDEWAPKGAFDFEEFVSNYPISVMFSVIGAPAQEIGEIKSSLEWLGLGLGLDPSKLPEIEKAHAQLEQLVLRLIEERRAQGEGEDKEDLLQLATSLGQGSVINERQLIDLMIFLFVAGYDTSKNVLTHIMYTLLDYPGIYEKCAKDLDFCMKVTEEGLRYFSPAISPRITSEDLEFRDVFMPKGTPILFTLNISGRDPDTFENPEVFDPDRKIENTERQIAFGLGRHMCLGQFIARVQIQEGLHHISRRILHPRLNGQVGWRPFPSTWGLKGLPIQFTPA